MSNMFGKPQEHEESVQARVAQRDGVQPIEGSPPAEGKPEEPVVPAVESPMVVTPDGKMVKPEEFDLFSNERNRLIQEEERLLNLRDTIVAETGGALGGGNGGNAEGETPEENAATIPRIELSEDAEYVDDTQRAMVDGFNNLAAAFENNAKQSQENIAEITKQVGEVAQQSDAMRLETELTAVEAHYGVDRDALFAASRSTGISHPETLAKIVMGEKAQTDRVEEAHENARNERVADAGGISGGGTRGAGNDGSPGQREAVDYNDNEALARVYRVSQPERII